jgi:hypothetical protein
MIKKAFLLAAMVAMGSVAMAQQQRSASGEPIDPREQCVMAGGLDWARIGVNTAQVKRINAIQASCQDKCSAAKQGEGELTEVIDKYIADLQTILSPQQFADWNKWCSGLQTTGKDE